MQLADKVCLGIILLIIISTISYFTYTWYEDYTKEEKTKKTEVLFVREGDTLEFEFTEWIFTRDTNGKLQYCVYQTTDESIANDPDIPKSVTFQRILANSTLAPKTAIVGRDLSDEINPGFNKLVLDMKEGQSVKNVEVSMNDGYGEKDEELIGYIPLMDTLPIYETIDLLEFEEQYSSEVPLEPGMSFKHYYWGWSIRIDSILNDTVVIKHEPLVNSEVAVLKWPATVVNISSENGLIWISHKPENSMVFTPIDAEVMEFYDPIFENIQTKLVEEYPPYPGIVTTIENEITIDFNRENIGKSLKYNIKIIDIERD